MSNRGKKYSLKLKSSGETINIIYSTNIQEAITMFSLLKHLSETDLTKIYDVQ